MQQRPFLVSPRLDFWILGGAYFAVLVPVYFLFGSERSTPGYFQLMATFTYLGYAVNYPHFLVSYQLLYGDHRAKLTSQWRFIWAAWISPIVIGGFLLAAFLASKALLMGFLISLMILLSGWHYVKQTFGALIVRSVHTAQPFSKSERIALKTNLIAMWFGGWLYATAFYMGPPTVHGIRVFLIHFPSWLGYLGLATGILSFLYLAWVFRKRFSLGVRSQLPELGIYATGPAWTFPYLATPIYQVIYPFFHCLQYFAFVIAFRRNKGANVWGYALLSVILGAAVFLWIPEALDREFKSEFLILGPMPFVAAANVFLNLHHYVIDSVIWKGSDPDVRANLFGMKPSDSTNSNLKSA